MMVALLVAENSVRPILSRVIRGLLKWTNVQTVVLAVPARQLKDFAYLKSPTTEVIPENEIIPGYSLDYFADRLGDRRARAGWYLQQFAKIGFSRIAADNQYVIWDADTVALRPIVFFEGGKLQITMSKEYHQPYFAALEKLINQRRVLRFSAISQYMPVDASCTRKMLEKIEQIHCKPWIDAVLSVLPLQGDSEFSEYETLANYMASEYPDRTQFVRKRWFRYGTDICGHINLPTNSELEKIFRRYSYVSFERHHHSRTKHAIANAMLKVGNILLSRHLIRDERDATASTCQHSDQLR
jgi:hypothetical protein